MIESVVALLMFVNAEIKEARLQVDGWLCVCAENVKLKELFLNQSLTNAGKGRPS